MLFLTATALLLFPHSARATLESGEPAEDILGEFASPSSDTTADYTKNCPNNGASSIGFNNNAGSVMDSVNHWLFVPEQGNNRVVVFPLNGSNQISSKTASYVLGQTSFITCAANEGGSTSQSSLSMGQGSLCVDSTDQLLYVPDENNNRVMVFSTASMSNGENASYELGQASGGTAFTANGHATTQGRLYKPTACAYDSTNHLLYVTDTGNNRAMVFSTSSIANGENASYVLGQSGYTTATAATTQAGMNGPNGISLDSSDQQLYVTDATNNRTLMFPAYGNASWTGSGENALIAFGQSSFTAGSANEGGSTSQISLDAPSAAAYDGTNYRLFVADTSNNRALVFNTANVDNGENAVDLLGEYNSSTMADNPDYYTKNCPNDGASPFGFSSYLDNDFPFAFDEVNHRLFVADSDNNRVLVFTLTSGNLISSKTPAYVLGQTSFTNCSANQGNGYTMSQSSMGDPAGLAFDATNNRLFVSDQLNDRVLVFNTSSISNGMNASYELGCTDFTGDGCSTGTTQATLIDTGELALDSSNNLYVADSYNNRVMIFNVATGSISNGENASHVLGQSSFTTATAATSQSGMSHPYGLAFDSVNSRLFVSDAYNNRVLVFGTSSLSNGENASYVLGQSNFTTGTSPEYTDQSGFATPLGLAYDSTNTRLFVVDNTNSRVMIFPVATGSIANGENASYVLGQTNFSGNYANGGDTNATNQSGMSGPNSAAYDSTNSLLYVGDAYNNRVMLFDVSTTVPTASSPTQAGADACAIASGQLYCWGGNFQGEDGLGNAGTQYTTPQQVGASTNWTLISQGNAAFDSSACGIAGGNLYCWGDNVSGENGNGTKTEDNSPVQVTSPSATWSTVSQVGSDACAITTAGALYCWGVNYGGEDGVGNTTQYTTPQQVTSPSLTWSSVSTGGYDTCGITTAGALYCWGLNEYGEDGLGNTNEDYTTPQEVGLPTTPNWSAPVTQSGDDGCGIQGGALYCWGYNNNGEDGTGNSTENETPVEVGSAANWIAISEGDPNFDEAGCGIRGSSGSGSLWCWGKNSYGELGLNNTTAYNTPQQVGSNTNWSSVSTSGNDTCAINTSGNLYCWGKNAYGEVGNGGTSEQNSPVEITTPSATGWSAVSTGGYDTCGINSGTLYCWGENAHGELGFGNASNTVFVTAAAVSSGDIGTGGGIAGADGVCASAASAAGLSGTYDAWITTTTALSPLDTWYKSTVPYMDTHGNTIASNFTGLTSGTLTTAITYTQSNAVVTGNPVDVWTNVASGGGATTSSASSNTANCAGWTSNSSSKGGDYGVTGSTSSTWTASGTDLACSTSTAHLYCFEQDPTPASSTTPVQVGTATDWITISQGGYDTCGIQGSSGSGELYCWGYNHQDELGLGNATEFNAPQAVGTSISTTAWTAVSIQYDGTNDGDACGIASGALYCWGHNADGEVGNNTTTAETTPVQVTAISGTWSSVSYGANDTCGVNGTTLYCWGHNSNYEDGTGTATENKTPKAVSQPFTYTTTWSTVSQGAYDTCAITTGGALYCWGYNQYGELGLGNTTQYTEAQQVGASISTTGWTAISIQNGGGNVADEVNAAADACGIAGGKLYCWGQNSYGEDGLGNTTSYNTPQQVGTSTNWTAVSFSFSDTCGVNNGQLYCWGYNYFGEDGVGTATENTTPQPVGGLDSLGDGEDATDELGEYSSAASSATVEWAQNGPNNGPNDLGFYQPFGVAIDSVHHYLYVSDTDNARVLIYALTSSNTLSTASGGHTASYVLGQAGFGGQNGATTQSTLGQPEGLAIDTANQRLFVADSSNNRVMVFSTASLSNGENASYELGQPSGTAFTSQTAATTQSGLNGPADVGYDSVNNRLYVADYTNNRVMVFNVATGSISNGENASYVLGQSSYTAKTAADTQAGMDEPISLSYDSTNQRLFVADEDNNRVLEYSTSSLSSGENASAVIGQGSFTAHTCAFSQTGMCGPTGVTYDPVDGWLFVANCTAGNIVEYNAAPGALPANSASADFVLGATNFAQNPASLSQSALSLCAGTPGVNTLMTYDPVSAHLYVADMANNRVLVFNANNPGNPVSNEAASYVLGQTGFTGASANQGGSASQSDLNTPAGAAFDSTNDLLYVDDSNNNRVMQFNVAPTSIANGENASDELGEYTSPSSTATDLWTASGPNNGPTALGFNANEYDGESPVAALDGVHHYLYVADQGNNRVLVYALNTDNSISSASGGHTASYVIGQTSLQGANGNGYFPAEFENITGLAVDTANQRLFVVDSGADYIDIFSTASLATGMSASNYLGGASGTTQSYVNNPYGAAYDAVNNRLFVADSGNNRVLVYSTGSVSNGMNASYELGQPSATAFTSKTAAASQSGMDNPVDLAFDPVNERLFVADCTNNRVTVFNVAPGSISNGENASYVLGQSSFTAHGTATTQAGLDDPYGVSYDATNSRLFVADVQNSRVLEFNVGPSVIANGENASFVLGQANFTTGQNQAAGIDLTQSGLDGAASVYYDPGSGRLFVGDWNNRVMIFEAGSMWNWQPGYE